MRKGLSILLCLVSTALAQETGGGIDEGFVVAKTGADAYIQPASALSYPEKQTFLKGRSHFKRRWIAPITFRGEWGLGPTFIQTRCSECHINNGRGRPPESSDEQLTTMLVRLSIPGENENGGPLPHPDYGDQFQNNALQAQEVDMRYAFELVPAEVQLFVDWEERMVKFADGEQVSLRKPILRVENPSFGALGEAF